MFITAFIRICKNWWHLPTFVEGDTEDKNIPNASIKTK